MISFFGLVASRVPNKESILGRSKCDHCHEPLRFLDVIPVFGYVINLGKCHSCKRNISISYLIFEVVGGLLFSLSFLLFEWSIELPIALIMIIVLMTETASDISHQLVLDIVWIPGAVILIVLRILEHDVLPYIISSSILFSLMFLISFVGKKVYKKEALGGGDIKLYVFIGFVLKIFSGLLSFFLASILALLFAFVKRKGLSTYIPLVPFIAIGVMVSYFLGDAIISWYLSLF
ncbi:MAG: prepilin peptidase [Bacilli bacterium]|nr:prepilin peptidase [Bacilli bacterium]